MEIKTTGRIYFECTSSNRNKKWVAVDDVNKQVRWLKKGLNVGVIGDEMYDRICATIDQAFEDIKGIKSKYPAPFPTMLVIFKVSSTYTKRR